MERQSKEYSIALWGIEKMDTNYEDLPPILKELFDVVEKKINDGSLTYDELCNDIVSICDTMNIIENGGSYRPGLFHDMCQDLINTYRK